MSESAIYISTAIVLACLFVFVILVGSSALLIANAFNRWVDKQ